MTQDIPPQKPKLTADEKRIRQEDRLKTIRLRMAIGRELDDLGITDHPAEIGTVHGMPTAEADKLLTRYRAWFEIGSHAQLRWRCRDG